MLLQTVPVKPVPIPDPVLQTHINLHALRKSHLILISLTWTDKDVGNSCSLIKLEKKFKFQHFTEIFFMVKRHENVLGV